MSILLSVEAIEASSYQVDIAIKDENGDPVIPATLKWSLMDRYGAVINSRSSVDITPLAANVSIILTPDDLTLDPGYTFEERSLVLEGTYVSPDDGTTRTLPATEFLIRVRAVTKRP